MHLHDVKREDLRKWLEQQLAKDDLCAGNVPGFEIHQTGLTPGYEPVHEPKLDMKVEPLKFQGATLAGFLESPSRRAEAIDQVKAIARALIFDATRRPEISSTLPVDDLSKVVAGLPGDLGLEAIIVNPQHRPDLGRQPLLVSLARYSEAIDIQNVVMVHGGRADYLITNESDILTHGADRTFLFRLGLYKLHHSGSPVITLVVPT